MARGARLAFVALTVGFILCAPRAAHACSCAPGVPLCDIFSRTSAVFTGEVIEITDEPSDKRRSGQPPARRRVTLLVDRIFRGAPAKRLEVYTGSGRGDCGYPFKSGEKYLVFASEMEGRLAVNVCSPTRPLAVASEVLDKITSSCVSQAAHLVVRGSIVRPNSRSASGVKVVVYNASAEGKGEVVGSAVSDRRGEFSIRLPIGGRYIVAGSTGDERGEVGPFELTPATAPVLLVIRRLK